MLLLAETSQLATSSMFQFHQSAFNGKLNIAIKPFFGKQQSLKCSREHFLNLILYVIDAFKLMTFYLVVVFSPDNISQVHRNVCFCCFFLLFFACCQVCVQCANELKAMWVVICQTGPISKSNISTIIAGQFGCFWQIVNLLNCSAFKKAQGTKTQVGWDWEEILLGGSVKTQNIHSRQKIFS